jgi:hypothetical protein
MKNLFKSVPKEVEESLKNSTVWQAVSPEDTVKREVEKLLTDKDIFTEEVGMKTIQRLLRMATIHVGKGNLIKFGFDRKDQISISNALKKVNFILEQIN